MPPLGRVKLLVFLPFRNPFFTVGGGGQRERINNLQHMVRRFFFFLGNIRQSSTIPVSHLNKAHTLSRSSAGSCFMTDKQTTSCSDCTLYLVQRQHEVLVCRDVLQHHGQFSFVLHCGVYAAFHLHKHSQHVPLCLCVCLCTNRRGWFLLLPWAEEHTTPLSGCRAPRSQRSAPPLPGSCCVQTGRGATRTPEGIESPAASGWSRTARHRETGAWGLNVLDLSLYCSTHLQLQQTWWWWGALLQTGIDPHCTCFIATVLTTETDTHPQVLIENGVDGVGLDARLPLALPWHIRQQVRLHVTTKRTNKRQGCSAGVLWRRWNRFFIVYTNDL